MDAFLFLDYFSILSAIGGWGGGGETIIHLLSLLRGDFESAKQSRGMLPQIV